jgi:hypothetical protein
MFLKLNTRWPLGANPRSRTADHLKTDNRTLLLAPSLGGKLQAKSSGWDEKRIFLDGDVVEVEYAMAVRC